MDDEPITQRVKDGISREEERRENLQYRRESDRRDYWVKTVTNYLLAIIISVVGAIIIGINNDRDIRNKHEIFITRNTEDIAAIHSDLKGLQESKNNNSNLEKLISGQMANMQERLQEQDKRWQMQGEGLIQGNKSIHDALQRIIEVDDELSELRRIITEISGSPFTDRLSNGSKRKR